jgi:NAD(P)-dependent dehydrogenase (short-subunit alcohol dehydrogenase family)
MLLENKVAVIYGAGGAIGSTVARAFAREGARLFLTGRHRAPVDAVVKDVNSNGRPAETAEVDALDEQAVDRHLQSVIDKAGRVDISFNAIGIPNTRIQGVPLVDLDVEQFSLPIATYARSYFLTARLAARRMLANRSGVIMTVTSVPSRTGIPLMEGSVRRCPPWNKSRAISPPSSHLRAFAWSVCDRRGCRIRARSRESSRFTPRHGESPGNSSAT